MRILKHNNGFVMVDRVGSVTIVEPYGGKQRCFVKVDGDNIALFAPTKLIMENRVNRLLELMTSGNKGELIMTWEDLI